jgi:hypothetical protein
VISEGLEENKPYTFSTVALFAVMNHDHGRLEGRHEAIAVISRKLRKYNLKFCNPAVIRTACPLSTSADLYCWASLLHSSVRIFSRISKKTL